MRYTDEETTYIHVLVTKVLKDELTKEANARQLSIASYVRQILLDRKKPDEE